MLALLIRMQTLTVRSIEAKSHPETKALLWYLFVGTKGGQTRVRIISQLRNKPSNKNQLAKDLGMDYKGIEHHMKTLEKNNYHNKPYRTLFKHIDHSHFFSSSSRIFFILE